MRKEKVCVVVAMVGWMWLRCLEPQALKGFFFLFPEPFFFFFPSFLTGLGYRDEPVTDANLMGKIDDRQPRQTGTRKVD